MKREKIWTYYKGLHGYAIYNNKYKYISHYENTEIEALRCCLKWNKEGREF